MAGLAVSAFTTSYMFRLDALAAMRHLKARFGFRRFTVFVSSPHFWLSAISPAQRREVPRILKGEGLEIAAICYPPGDYNLASYAPDVRRLAQADVRGYIELAGEWGVEVMMVVPGRVSPLMRPPRDLAIEHFVEGARVLAPAARDAGVRLLYENVPVTPFPRAADLLAAVEAAGERGLGILYDITNGTFVGDDPCADLDLVWPHLGMIDASDTRRDTYQHAAVGTGVVRFDAVAETLKARDWRGVTAIEMIVALDPDGAFAQSLDRMAALGWEDPHQGR